MLQWTLIFLIVALRQQVFSGLLRLCGGSRYRE